MKRPTTPGHARAWQLAVIVSATLTIAGCGTSDEERLARGTEAFAAGEYNAAILDAKSVLQQAADNTEARLLLARASLAVGDAATAEEAFRRVMRGGNAADDVVVDMARTLLLQRKYTELLRELSVDDVTSADDKFSIRLARADAQVGLGLSRTARVTYEELLQLDPESSAARLGLASSYVTDNDFDSAQRTLAELTSRDPDYVRAWLSRGSIAMTVGDTQAAAGFYQTALEAAERLGDRTATGDALAGLIETQLRNGDSAAATTFERLKVVSPDALVTRYLNARVDFEVAAFESANSKLARLLRDAPGYIPARLLFGATQFRLGNIDQADSAISALLRDVPNSDEARLLLAEIRLRQGRGAEIADIIRPALASGRNTETLTALAIRGSMQSEQYDSTIALLRERLEQSSSSTQSAIELAGALLAAGQITEAEVVLAGTSDDSATTSLRKEMLAIYASLRGGNASEALDKASQLVAAQPESAAAQSILANVALATGRLDLARASFATTQQLDPTSVAAYLAVARMDVVAGDLDAARQELTRARRAAPDELIVSIALAKLELRAGDVGAAKAVLDEAIAAHPDAVLARLALGEVALASNDVTGALSAANAALKQDPNNATANNIAGVATERSGDAAKAAEYYVGAVKADPTTTVYRINAARAYIETEDFQLAESILLDSGRVPLNDIQRVAALISLKMRLGDDEAAESIIRNLKTNQPNDPRPFVLAGRLAVSRGDYSAAAKAFDDALTLSRFDRSVVMLAHNARAVGKLDKPEAPLLRYLEQQPDDLSMLVVLAQSYLQQARMSDAIGTYEKALSLAPNNVTVLNNLAWLYSESDDARAEPTARRGYEFGAASAEMTDTLGWILFRAGKNEEALQRLQDASTLAPSNPSISYHLAAALAKNGDVARAKGILEQILQPGSTFSDRAEAEALRETL